jgi:hypothetical protein
LKKFAASTAICFVVVSMLAGISYAIAAWYGLAGSSPSPLWANFWSVFSNVILLATLLVVVYYTYETYNLRKATVDSNALSFRPILVFDAGAPFCTVKNKGNGPALNICLIIWDGSKMKVTADSAVPGIMPPGNDSYCFVAHEEMDSVGFKKKLPDFASLIERVTSTRHSLFCLTYRDLAGNRLYSIINGSNQINYEGVFEHGTVGAT